MSTTNPTPLTDASRQKRARKRIYIPLILLLLLLISAVGIYLRGTWADSVEKTPSRPEEGTVTQLLKKPDGNVVVRCAVVVDARPQEVWAVIIDYEGHPKFLPYVSKVKASKQADGQFLIDGITHSSLWGDWPFQSLVTHTEKPETMQYATHWNEVDKDLFKVSRGGWRVRAIEKSNQQSLLVFELQIELKDYPNFLVRNVVMDRLYTIVEAMRDEALRRKGA